MLKTIMNAKNKLISETEPDVAWHNAGEHSCSVNLLVYCKNLLTSKVGNKTGVNHAKHTYVQNATRILFYIYW